MAWVGWNLVSPTSCNEWKKPSTNYQKSWCPTDKDQIPAPMIVMVVLKTWVIPIEINQTGADKSFRPNWLSWNSRGILATPNIMVQQSGTIFWIPRHYDNAKGVASVIPSGGGSESMVAVVTPILQGRRTRNTMGRIFKRTVSSFRTDRMRRLWWSFIKGETSWFVAWLPKGIWKAWESGARMDPKGISRDVYGWSQTGDCGRHSNVKT